MNHAQLTVAVFGAILAILGLIGTFGSPRWLEDRTISMAFLFIGTILVVGSLILFILDLRKQEKEEEMATDVGALQPAFAGLISGKVNINAYPCMEIGDSGVGFEWAGTDDKSLFRIFDKLPVYISKDCNGQIKISTNIRGRDGSVVVLEDNEWKVNPSQIFDRNYDKNTLEVKDNNGEIVLQMRVLDDRIQFQGKFYDKDGKGVALVGRKSLDGCIIEQTGFNHPNLEAIIDPIFIYPSKLHFGELCGSLEIISPLVAHKINSPLIINSQSKGSDGTIFTKDS